MKQTVEIWLSRFSLDPELQGHVALVLYSVPTDVRADLLNDPGFAIYQYEPRARMVQIPIAAPGPHGAGRSVALKCTLLGRAPEFVRYVIAHELAHAFLRNAGRHPEEDPEHAADALAAQWGFPKPDTRFWLPRMA